MLSANPSLIVTSVLTIGVILVNGWTDAPNAIATCVSTRSIRPGRAIIMAAVFNLLGTVVMSLFNQSVAKTIFHMVDFGGNAQEALIALCAAMVAIVLWAVLAWRFGIPTSESHALIAGLSGAAVALHGSFGGINGSEWLKVIYGLILSTFMGFGLGFITTKGVELLFRHSNRRKADSFFRKAQVAGGAAMAFMHGAQDGQKFISVFLIGMFLAQGQSDAGAVGIPVWLMILCAVVMGLGTSIGGYRIIKAVGMDMVRLSCYQGFSSDLSAAVCLLISSVTGIPVSTTHTKTTAIMGVGASGGLKKVNWSIVREMVLTWVLTFPGCGALGFVMAKLFILVFSF
jgi:PiT family inorganic phosphate transporter